MSGTIAEPTLAALGNPLLRYFTATRPAFLSVTLVGCLLGLASAHAGGVPIDALTATVTLLFALAAHAGVNVLNDYFDARNGTDVANTERIFPYTGGSRFIQNGVLSLRATAVFGYTLLAAVVVAGLWLTAHSATPLLWIGFAGLLVGWAYSAPPLQLVSRGLGEAAITGGWLLVVVGTDFVQRRQLAFAPLACGLAFALLVANLLYINQFPDLKADALAGKRTLVVRLGTRHARWGYVVIIALSCGWVVGCIAGGKLPVLALLALTPLLLSVAAARVLWRFAARPAALTPAIKLTIAAAVGHGLLMCVALLVAGIASAQSAEAPVDGALRAVQELGVVNGQALACHADATAVRGKQLMLLHAPRTSRFGEAFESATQSGYLDQVHGTAPCPAAEQFAARMDSIARVLRQVLPVGAGDAAAAPVINPRYVLQDARGRAVSNEDFPGRLQLIAFGYTACPDVCPTTLASMAQALRLLGAQAERVQPIFISVDPERDSGEQLAAYTERFDGRLMGLTGPPELVAAVVEHFGLQVQRNAEPGAAPQDYAIDHSSGLYLLDASGGFVARLAAAMPPQEIATRLKLLLSEEGH